MKNLLLLALLGAAATASAAAPPIITSQQTVNFALPADAVSFASSQAMVDQFDPAHGTLLGVRLDFTSVVSNASVTAKYQGEGFILQAAQIGDQFNVSFVGPAALSGAVTQLVAGAQDFALPTCSPHVSCTTLPMVAVIDPGTATTTLFPDTLSSFVGTGQLGIALNVYAYETYDGTAGIFESASFKSQLASAVKVTYSYTPAASPVPEPQSWMLSLVGLAALACRVRRSQRPDGDSGA